MWELARNNRASSGLTPYQNGMALRASDLTGSQLYLAGLFASLRPPPGLCADDYGLVSGTVDAFKALEKSFPGDGFEVRLDSGLHVKMKSKPLGNAPSVKEFLEIVCGFDDKSAPVMKWSTEGDPTDLAEIGRFRVYPKTARGVKGTEWYPEVANVGFVNNSSTFPKLHDAIREIRAVMDVFGFPLLEGDVPHKIRSGTAKVARLTQLQAVEQLGALLDVRASDAAPKSTAPGVVVNPAGSPAPKTEVANSGDGRVISFRRFVEAAGPLMTEDGLRSVYSRDKSFDDVVGAILKGVEVLKKSWGEYFVAMHRLLAVRPEYAKIQEQITGSPLRDTICGPTVSITNLKPTSVYLVLVRATFEGTLTPLVTKARQGAQPPTPSNFKRFGGTDWWVSVFTDAVGYDWAETHRPIIWMAVDYPDKNAVLNAVENLANG